MELRPYEAGDTDVVAGWAGFVPVPAADAAEWNEGQPTASRWLRYAGR